MATRKTGAQILKDLQNSGAGRIDFANLYVNLSLGNANEVSKQVRVIGYPIEFYEVNQMQKDPKNPKGKPIKVPYPDAHLNKSFTRICHDDPSECPWTQMGYIRTRKWAVNVIERELDADGIPVEGAPVVVRVLNKGKGVFGKFFEEEDKNKKYNEKMEKKIAAGKAKGLWTCIGGEIAPDAVITVTKNEKNFGGVEYSVFFDPNPQELTEEEIEALRAIGQPTAEELEKIRAEIREANPDNPELADFPDWYFYGYKLENLFKPTPLKTEEKTTSTAELTMDNSSDEDDTEDDAEVDDTTDTEATTDGGDTSDGELPEMGW